MTEQRWVSIAPHLLRLLLCSKGSVLSFISSGVFVYLSPKYVITHNLCKMATLTHNVFDYKF